MTKQMVTGIIGAGRIGKLHVQNIHRIPHMKIKAVSDISASCLQDWAASHHIEYITADYRDLLLDPDIDAVFICSPTNTHTQIIREAAEAKKHIFVKNQLVFLPMKRRRHLRLSGNMGLNCKSDLTAVSTLILGKSKPLSQMVKSARLIY